MKIIHKYLIRETTKSTFFVLALFCLIFFISDLFWKLSEFIAHHAKIITIFKFFLLCIPNWVSQVLPLSILLGSLFSISKMNANNEITVIKSSGINLFYFLFPIFIFGLLFSVFLFVLNETILPSALRKLDLVYTKEIKGEDIKEKFIFSNIQYIEKEGWKGSIGSYNEKEKSMTDIFLEKIEKSKREQIIAEKGVWSKDGSFLYNVVHRIFENGNFNEKKYDKISIKLLINPVLLIPKNKIELMTISELKNEINIQKMKGTGYQKHLLFLYSKFSQPLTCILTLLISIPFGLMRFGKEGKLLHFTYALIVTFVYWNLNYVFKILGETENLDPFLSAWCPNIIFLLFGLFFLFKIER